MDYTRVGKIIGYFEKTQMVVMKIDGSEIKNGYEIRIGEFGTGFVQKIESVKKEKKKVEFKVIKEVKIGDLVYKVSN